VVIDATVIKATKTLQMDRNVSIEEKAYVLIKLLGDFVGNF
jgi:hypothetical protein